MLDSYMAVIEKQAREQAQQMELVSEMRKLPEDLLQKVANGQFKFAEACEGVEWLRQFQGTPLLDAALQIEQQEINIDEMRQQRMQEERSLEDQFKPIHEEKSKLRHQRKLLELQLFAHQSGAGASPPPPPPPMDTPASPLPAPEQKVASEEYTTIQWADVQRENAELMGKKLAHAEVAQMRMTALATEVGEELAKQAFDAAGAGRMLGRGIGGAAVGAQQFGAMLKANPGAAVGAAVGGLGGLAGGLQKDQNGQRHILGGIAQGAVGAGLGAGAGLGLQKGVGAIKGRLNPSTVTPHGHMPAPAPVAAPPKASIPLEQTPAYKQWAERKAQKAPTQAMGAASPTAGMVPPRAPAARPPAGRIDTNVMMGGGQPMASPLAATVPGKPLMPTGGMTPPLPPPPRPPAGRMSTNAMMGG